MYNYIFVFNLLHCYFYFIMEEFQWYMKTSKHIRSSHNYKIRSLPRRRIDNFFSFLPQTISWSFFWNSATECDFQSKNYKRRKILNSRYISTITFRVYNGPFGQTYKIQSTSKLWLKLRSYIWKKKKKCSLCVYK